MTPDIEKFINLATRYLGERPKDRDAARSELMARLSHQSIPVDQIDLSIPIERLDKAKAWPTWVKRSIKVGAFLLLTIFAFAWMWHEAVWLRRVKLAEYSSHREPYVMDAHGGYWDNILAQWVEKELSNYNTIKKPIYDNIEDLRLRDPRSLALLEISLIGKKHDRSEFCTSDQRELIAQLDADNALWPIMELSWLCAHANESSSVFVGPNEDLTQRIRDALGRASQCSKYESYSHSFISNRIKKDLPKAGTVAEDRVINGVYYDLLISQRAKVNWDGYWAFRDFMLNELDRLNRVGDTEAIREYYYQIIKIGILENNSSVTRNWYGVVASFPLIAEMERKYNDYGVEPEATKLAGVTSKFYYKTPGAYSSYYNPMYGYRVSRTDIMEFTVSVDDEKLMPSLRADMAYANRLTVWPGFILLFLLLMLVGFEVIRRPNSVRGLAKGLMPLLSIRDYIWIASIGILFPWLYWWIITRLTPLGIDKLNFEVEWMVVNWGIQSFISLILAIVILVQTIQWRWSVKGRFLHMQNSSMWAGWLVIAILLLALPAAGMTQHLPSSYDDHRDYFLWGYTAAGSTGVVWLLWIGGMNLFTSRRAALQPNLVSRTLIPWLMAGMASLLLAAATLCYAEKYWYEKDTLLPLWTSNLTINALYEHSSRDQGAHDRSVFVDLLK